MSPSELCSCCFCHVLSYFFAEFQRNLVPKFFSVNGALTCSGLHFLRYFLVKQKILPNLVIINWLWWIMRVQYFEWIIIVIKYGYNVKLVYVRSYEDIQLKEINRQVLFNSFRTYFSQPSGPKRVSKTMIADIDLEEIKVFYKHF